jgi:hypothetical protein
MEEQPKAKGGGDHRVFQKPGAPKSYREMGIDKNLAERARRTHAMPRGEFEKMIAKGREEIYRSAERVAAQRLPASGDCSACQDKSFVTAGVTFAVTFGVTVYQLSSACTKCLFYLPILSRSTSADCNICYYSERQSGSPL